MTIQKYDWVSKDIF